MATIVFIPPNASGACQWTDQGLHLDIKKATDTEKKNIYDNNKNLTVDLANNNGNPICHTKNGNKKALNYPNQALCICKGFESLRAKNDTERYHKQLLYTGYLWKTEKNATIEAYLSNLEKNVTDVGNIFKCINALSINPFISSFEKILGARQRPGRKVTDLGKTTRIYSTHESRIIDEYRQHSQNSNSNNSNSNSNSNCNSNCNSNGNSNSNDNTSTATNASINSDTHSNSGNNNDDDSEVAAQELTNSIHFDKRRFEITK